MFGACGCGNCIIGSDDFSANDGNPHAGWTNRPAIWGTPGGDEATNASGVFQFAKPNTQKFNTANPEGAGSGQHVRVRFKPHELNAEHGVNAEVIIGYSDDTHYLAASVYNYQSGTDEPCWYLQLLKRDTTTSNGYYDLLTMPDGTNALVPLKGMAFDQWHTLDVCLIPNNYGTYGDGDTVRAIITLANGSRYGVQGIAEGYTTGAYAGLANAYTNYGTGGGDNTKYGEVEFDDFEFTYFRESPDHRSCPNCNGPCLIYADNFTYDDVELDTGSTTGCPDCPDCFWLLLSGAARISSNELEIDSGGRVRCQFPHPTGKTSKIVTVSLKWEADIVARVDLGTGYVLFDESAGEMQLYDAADNPIGDPCSLGAADDALHVAVVSYDGHLLRADFMDCCLEEMLSDDGSDPFVYLGSDGGTVHFDNFSFEKYRDTSEPKDSNCEHPDCPSTVPCLDDTVFIVGTTPRFWQVSVIGVPSGPSPDCTGGGMHCDRFSGYAWICEYDGSQIGACNYENGDPLSGVDVQCLWTSGRCNTLLLVDSEVDGWPCTTGGPGGGIYRTQLWAGVTVNIGRCGQILLTIVLYQYNFFIPGFGTDGCIFSLRSRTFEGYVPGFSEGNLVDGMTVDVTLDLVGPEDDSLWCEFDPSTIQLRLESA